MFNLRQAFNAGVAGLCGVGLADALATNQREKAVFAGMLLVANVVFAGMSDKAPSP